MSFGVVSNPVNDPSLKSKGDKLYAVSFANNVLAILQVLRHVYTRVALSKKLLDVYVGQL
jgi:hypothetical protein